jgi:hypothetical protein
MTKSTQTEKFSSELLKKYKDMSENELTEIYKKFQRVSTTLYRVSELDTEIDNLKELLSNKSSKTTNIIYLVIFILITISLFYFDKIEYTLIVLLIYFTSEIEKDIRKNKNELLINLKNTQKYQLQLECLTYGFEMNHIESLVREIKKIPSIMNDSEYFYKDINTSIFYELSRERDVRNDIEYLLTTENRYNK